MSVPRGSASGSRPKGAEQGWPERRELGRSGVVVSPLGFGCGPNARLMVADEERAQQATVRHAIERGIAYFDTAAGYGDGDSETYLGRTLGSLGERPAIVTKVVLEEPDRGDIRGAIHRSVERSLDRLGRSDLDALLLHNRVAKSRTYPKPSGSGVLLHLEDVFGPGGVIEAFRDLLSDATVRSVGFTAFGGEPVAIEELIETGIFSSLNVSFNLLNASAARHLPVGFVDIDTGSDYDAVVEKAASSGIGVIAIRVLASGLLASPPEGDSMFARLIGVAADLGEPLVATAIRYVLSTKGIDSAVIGFSEPRHVDVAADAVRAGPLEPAVVETIDRIVVGGPTP